jgi:hypothetical protein
MKIIKKLKWILAALVVAFAVAQFFNPPRTNPPVKTDFIAATAPPPQIQNLLHAACYDCHSDQTRWPWYSHVAPVSWLLASDVNGGRRHVNFSQWPQTEPDLAARKIGDMSDEVDNGDMPPWQYKLIHAGARLTDDQRKELKNWLDAEADKVKAQNAAQ